jgi:hypothetical protein
MSTPTFWTLLVGSNLACMFLGFLFGRVTRAAVEIEEHMIQDNDSPPPSGETPGRGRLTSLRVLAVVVTLIGVATIVLGILVTREQAAADARDDRLTACITGYSNALADALDQRTTANMETNEAVAGVMQAFADAFSQAPADARENIRKALVAYTEARDKARESRAQTPLPEAPRDACAELLD